jgi:hypothetical protein
MAGFYDGVLGEKPMDTVTVNKIMAHQRRIDEIDKAIKSADNFWDRKAYLVSEDGSKTLLTRAELLTLREKEEAAIKQEQLT